jgi:hypothetical protein
MLALMASVGLSLLTSFIGSLCAFVIAQHYHLEDHWAERKAHIEAKRYAKRWAKATPEAKLQMERGLTVISDGQAKPLRQ